LKVWADVETGLPIERNYFDVNNKLYKIERYEHIVAIQNIPTITRVVMTDVQQGSKSELDVTAVKYYQKAPVKLFNPDYLPQAATDQFWKTAQ
jgi:translation elongation factor P/translation initiation factor 5A